MTNNKENHNMELVEKLKVYHAQMEKFIEEVCPGKIHPKYGLSYSTAEMLCRELYDKLGQALSHINTDTIHTRNPNLYICYGPSVEDPKNYLKKTENILEVNCWSCLRNYVKSCINTEAKPNHSLETNDCIECGAVFEVTSDTGFHCTKCEGVEPKPTTEQPDFEKVREALEFYQNGFAPYKEFAHLPGFAWKPKEELLDDCGEKAKEALSILNSMKGT